MPRDNTCWKCQGQGFVQCSSCKGDNYFVCDSCHSSGKQTCLSCGGEGEFYRRTRDAYRTACRSCQGKGEIDCRTCGGSGYKICRRCNGQGIVTCHKCNGTGKYPPFVEQKYTTVKEVSKEVVKKQENNGCFFATAIYQNVNAPEVQLLRRFRDEVLMCNFVGRVFIALYYAGLGKTLAKIVSYFGEPGRLVCKSLMKPIIRQLALR